MFCVVARWLPGYSVWLLRCSGGFWVVFDGVFFLVARCILGCSEWLLLCSVVAQWLLGCSGYLTIIRHQNCWDVHVFLSLG